MGAVVREIAAALEEVPNAECRRQAAIVLEGMQNFTLWALRMADATAKPPSELLRGNLRVLGDLDGCVGVVSPGAVVRGQYCLANVQVDTDDDTWNYLLDIATSHRRGGNEMTRHRVQLGQAIYPTTARMEWGVCAPAACAAADVQAALNAAARRLLAGTRLRLDFF
ncbi:Nose resistant to fluoxetine protein 6, partial [Gryllus bimaculatus]